jgi:teichoic acid transport system permease protein
MATSRTVRGTPDAAEATPPGALPGARTVLIDLHRGPRPSTLTRLWGARAFLVERASADLRRRHVRHRLGLAWVVLNPLLAAAVYLLLFGVLLEAGRGIDHYVTFLVIGVFAFQLTARTVQAATWTIGGGAKVIQTIRLPAAALPASMTLAELAVHLPGLLVIAVVATLDGVRPDVAWLLLLPATALQVVLTFGLALLIARLSFQVPDLSAAVPHALRVWLYLSGVLFGLDLVSDRAPALAGVFQANPMWLHLRLHRDAVLLGTADPATWVAAAAWAIGVLVVGLAAFGAREDAYSRG